MPESPVAASCNFNLVRPGSVSGEIWLRFVAMMHKPHGFSPIPAILIRVHERRPRLLQASSHRTNLEHIGTEIASGLIFRIHM
jgi:hypothetical protein